MWEVRHVLKARLKLRHIPELHLHGDATAASADHVNKLIRDARDEDRHIAHDRGEKDA